MALFVRVYTEGERPNLAEMQLISRLEKVGALVSTLALGAPEPTGIPDRVTSVAGPLGVPAHYVSRYVRVDMNALPAIKIDAPQKLRA
jgi:hypothetical protein